MNDNNQTQCDGVALEHLRNAEHDLATALKEERDAERHIVKAEAEIAEAMREEEEVRQFAVQVLYDGVKKPFEVRLEETVKRLLDEAIKAFGPLPSPHTLSLFKGTTELPDSQTIKEAGIKPHDVLLLRPSKVKGGRA
ncbi:MAG: hypothetical protein WAN65_14990 [Candidatus Sulfotelmatobacter sp.]